MCPSCTGHKTAWGSALFVVGQVLFCGERMGVRITGGIIVGLYALMNLAIQ
jgi:uncharacterized membrane protein YgdD (TMEM256/DUF423 family)